MESAISVLCASARGDAELPWTTTIPVLEKLKPMKTTYFPAAPVMKDESTTANNIFILEDLYKRQFNLDENDPNFKRVIRLVYGDLKTWSRIQSVKALRSDTSELAFDRFDWLLPGLGLWHLRLNFLQLIHRIHFGENHPKDPSTLQFAADAWDRSRVIQPNDFQALEELIIHSYQSRIVGVWVRTLRRERVDPKRIVDTIPWLTAQTPATWLARLKKIFASIHPKPLSMTPNMQPPEVDQEFENHRHFCAHVEVYLTLRYAIKHADIGLLRYALRHTAILFQAEVAGTPKYARALLYTLHLVDTPAASIRLQNCVLSNSLVNLKGGEDTNFEVDKCLELLNNLLKAFQNDRSYYSKHSDQLLEHWALNGPYFLELRKVFEFAFWKPANNAHSVKPASDDIWSMAISLAHQSLIRSKNDRFSRNPTVNLFLAGLSKLAENVVKYNEQYVQGYTEFDEEAFDTVPVPEEDETLLSAPGSPSIPSSFLEPLSPTFVE